MTVQDRHENGVIVNSSSQTFKKHELPPFHCAHICGVILSNKIKPVEAKKIR